MVKGLFFYYHIHIISIVSKLYVKLNSTWNNENKFTGWYDCPLSPKGHEEAKSAGALLKANNFKFDMAFTSSLKRAIRTLWHTLEETDCMSIPVTCAWQLNERFNPLF